MVLQMKDVRPGGVIRRINNSRLSKEFIHGKKRFTKNERILADEQSRTIQGGEYFTDHHYQN